MAMMANFQNPNGGLAAGQAAAASAGTWAPRKMGMFPAPRKAGNTRSGEYALARAKAGTRVHYCAYGHVYNKPTHIWTNLYEWKPQGQTGTGKCECRCNAGRVGPKGKWRHRYKIAGDSSLEVQGRGKAAMKNMVPQQLQQEIWASWRD